MKEAIRLNAAGPATAGADIKSPPRYERALEHLLKHRGNPLQEIERVLVDDPRNVFGHCLRAALIVSTDAIAARSSLAQSLAAIEAACLGAQNPARRHAAAAQAWFNGDSGSRRRPLWRHLDRLAARHSRSRGRTCVRLPPRPSAHAARSCRPDTTQMGSHDAPLRERPCDVCVRPRGKWSIPSR